MARARWASRSRGRVLVTAGIALALLVGVPAASAQVPGALDAGFVDPGFNSALTAVATQPDGRIMVAGLFSTIGGAPHGDVARLNADGSPDASFANPGIAGGFGGINAMILQPDGRVLIAGSFTSVGGTPMTGVARLNADGSLDTSFADPGVAGGNVNVLALQPDGRVLIGGQFTSVGGTPMARVARLNADGSRDAGFQNPQADWTVWSIVPRSDGRLLIGGEFDNVGGAASARLARLNADGTRDVTFAPSAITWATAPGNVRAIVELADGKLVIGGRFDAVGGQPIKNVARLLPDGTRDPGFVGTSFYDGPFTDAYVRTVVAQADGRLLIGGAFTQVGGGSRGGAARLAADGALDAAFGNPAADDPVYAIALQPDGRALFGGTFRNLGGAPRDYLARTYATAPQAAPTGITPTTGDGRVTVSWTAVPGAITGYTATANPGGATCTTTTATSCTITGLTNGTTYTVAVSAENAFGSGPAASTSAVPAPRTAAAAAAAKPSVTVTAPKARVTATGVIVTSQVTVSGAGRISQTATTGRRKRVVHCRVTKSVTAAGTYTLRCDLGAKGRTALRLRALKLTLRTAFTPTGADALTANRSITVKRRR